MHVDVIRDQARLDAMAEQWDELYAQCRTATPFQTHGWIAAWARAYCRPGRLRIVVVRSGSRLVAVAPFHLVRRGAWPVLAPLGGKITDYFDVLVPDPHGAAAAALTRALLREPSWRVIDLPELRPEAAAVAWAARWPGAVNRLDSSPSLELPARPVSELLTRVPGRTANVIRRKLRKIDAHGIEVGLVPAEQVEAAIAALLKLHKEQWRGRAINPEHLTSRFAAHLTEALRQMVDAGQALVVEYRLDGELVASQINLAGHRFLGYYLAGFSPALRKRIDVVSMLTRNDIELAAEVGFEWYSMLRGKEDFKLRWRPLEVRNQRLLLSRPGVLGGSGYPAAARAHANAIRLAKERAPWLRQVKQALDAAAVRR